LRGIIKYRHLLEGVEHIELISMGEGSTCMVKSRHIGPELGFTNLFFKLENLNPTGSYKDRFASLAVSGLVGSKSKLCLATSSGNTGASLAAYSALAGLPCHIAIVDGAPSGKLRQMQAYGAHLWMVEGFGISKTKTIKVFESLVEIGRSLDAVVQISAFEYSPFGMQGVQTISYEIAEELPRVNHVFVPAGGGGLALAVVRGFQKWAATTKNFKVPRVHCVQPSGNDTMASSIKNKNKTAKEIDGSSTAISGLQVPNIIDGNQVVTAIQNSGGNGFVVDDAVVFDWQKKLASNEGIYCEPAGAVSMAGFVNALKSNEISPNENIVCLITGHGFKDLKATEMMIVDNNVNHISETQEINLNGL
jgi:threonine synthase